MFRLPHNRRTRIQLTLVAAFLLTFYLGVRYAANWIEGGADFLELQDAIARGNMGDIERKLNASASPNVRNPGSGETALHVAIRYNNRETVELLLSRDANPNLKDEKGRTPLHGISQTNLELTRLLLDHGAQANVHDRDNVSPLHIAAVAGDIERVRLLVNRGASLHTWSDGMWQGTPGLIALHAKHVDVANYILLEAGGSDFDNEKLSLLLEAAAAAGESELVRRLLQAGASPTAPTPSGMWALNSAVSSGSIETVEIFLELDAIPLEDPRVKRAFLFSTAASTNGAVIDLLMEYGLDINVQDAGGVTALHTAARSGHLVAVRRLIERGANINARTNFGETPVYRAVKYSNVHVVELLLKHGANCAIADHAGTTPLALALRLSAHAIKTNEPSYERTNTEAVLKLLQKASAPLNSPSITAP